MKRPKPVSGSLLVSSFQLVALYYDAFSIRDQHPDHLDPRRSLCALEGQKGQAEKMSYQCYWYEFITVILSCLIGGLLNL